MNYALNYEYEVKEEEVVTEISDYRVDKTKDYVYFTNIEYPITGSFISRQDIVINLSGFSSLTETLNSSNEKFDGYTLFESDVELSSEETYFNNEEGIYYIMYREYTVVEYGKFITIIITDYEYSIKNLTNLVNIECYIIDKENNEIVTEDEILEIYAYDSSLIDSTVSEVLNAKVYSGEDIDVTKTMENFEYILYPNKVGSLEALYRVSSTNYDYYDKIVVS